MANATTTTTGDIQLAGDLGGNNDATAPTLTSVGITAGSYSPVGTIVTDAKGRILSITTSSLPDATTSSKGIVQIGSGIDVSSGVISLTLATNTTTGGVKSADTDNITIVSGEINTGTNIPRLNTPNTFTKAQHVTPSALTSGTSIVVDGSLSNIYTLTLGHNGTLENPTNLGIGRYIFIVKQNGTGSNTLAFGDKYIFTAAGSTIQSDANSVSILTCISDGTKLFCSLAKNFA